MLSGCLWPAHPKPLPGELLSSWFIRIARANGIKLHTLSRILFGTDKSPWNRDIDRSAPAWLVEAISRHSGVPFQKVIEATLVAYQGHLYRHTQSVGQLRWVLPICAYGTHHTAHGLQFCPACLSADTEPYFRKCWRIALLTYCPIHQVDLYDACPNCRASVMLHRGDFGKELWDANPMSVCHACGADFRDAENRPAWFPSEELRQIFDEMLRSLGRPIAEVGQFDLGFLSVLHQFCMMMGARQNQGKLQRYLVEQIGLSPLVRPTRRIYIEERRRDERHQWLLCALWLMVDLEHRLRNAWLAKAVQYNLMIKDFYDAPGWYRTLARRFSDWRRGLD